MTGLGRNQAYTTEAPGVRLGRIAAERVRSLIDCFWLQAAVRRAANSVCFTPSTGLSGSGVARYANLATNALNVRFLPIPSALPSRADAPSAIVDSRL